MAWVSQYSHILILKPKATNFCLCEMESIFVVLRLSLGVRLPPYLRALRARPLTLHLHLHFYICDADADAGRWPNGFSLAKIWMTWIAGTIDLLHNVELCKEHAICIGQATLWLFFT